MELVVETEDEELDVEFLLIGSVVVNFKISSSDSRKFAVMELLSSSLSQSSMDERRLEVSDLEGTSLEKPGSLILRRYVDVGGDEMVSGTICLGVSGGMAETCLGEHGGLDELIDPEELTVPDIDEIDASLFGNGNDRLGGVFCCCNMRTLERILGPSSACWGWSSYHNLFDYPHYSYYLCEVSSCSLDAATYSV